MDGVRDVGNIVVSVCFILICVAGVIGALLGVFLVSNSVVDVVGGIIMSLLAVLAMILILVGFMAAGVILIVGARFMEIADLWEALADEDRTRPLTPVSTSKRDSPL